MAQSHCVSGLFAGSRLLIRRTHNSLLITKWSKWRDALVIFGRSVSGISHSSPYRRSLDAYAKSDVSWPISDIWIVDSETQTNGCPRNRVNFSASICGPLLFVPPALR